MTKRQTPANLIETGLRRLIRGLLREADLSGKSSAPVGATDIVVVSPAGG